MSKYSWDFGVPDYFLQVQEALNTLAASAVSISKVWESAISQYDFNGVHTVLNAWLENYNSISDQISSISKSILPLIDTSVCGALRDLTAISEALQSVDWAWLSEVYSEDNGKNVSSVTIEDQKIAPEIRAEIAADITSVIAEPETMHITSRNKFFEWVKKSPENAMVFLNTLLVFIQTICMIVSTWQARPVKDSQVYQEPVSTSNVVYNLTVENTVTVVGDVPYYYEVEFVNPETGESVIGYIYKGNLTEVFPDAPEDVEASEATPDTAESQREPTE